MSARTAWRSSPSIVPSTGESVVNGIVGDLRRRPRQPPQQRGLARVGQPDQADVGEQLQPQLDPALLALGPVLGEARRLPRRGREALVAVPAAPAVGDHRPLPGLDQVDRLPSTASAWVPGGTGISRVLPARPVPVGPFAMPPALGAEVLAAPQRAQVAPRRVADEHDIAAVPAVAAVGPARGTCASRRNEMHPSPPAPPSTQIFALSYMSKEA